MEAGWGFAWSLRATAPLVVPESSQPTEEEAGGQLDGIRLIVVAGSLGSQLTPSGQAQGEACVTVDKLPVLGSERQPFVAAALLTAWAAYLKGQAGGPGLKRLGHHSHSERFLATGAISPLLFLSFSLPSLRQLSVVV